jgi:ATP-dependent Zn protease
MKRSLATGLGRPTIAKTPSSSATARKRFLPRFNAIAASWLLGALVSLGTPASATPEKREPITYGQLLEKIEANEVARVELDPSQQIARVRLKTQAANEPAYEVKLFENNPELIEKSILKAIPRRITAPQSVFSPTYSWSFSSLPD